MIRSVPKNACDRYLGEGDRCIRDKYGRIIAWSVGMTDEDWNEMLKTNLGSYESVGMYDTEKGMVI